MSVWGALMMIVNVVKCMLMMIRKDTKRVRGGGVSLWRTPFRTGLFM